MMRSCIIFLCLAVCSLAQQEKCCVKQEMFAATSGSVTGYHTGDYNGVVGNNVFAVADFIQSKSMANTTLYVEGNTTYMMAINDYKQNTEWTIDFTAKKCEKAPLPEGSKLQRCIPDDATFLEQVTYPGNVLVNFWNMELNTPTQKGQVTLSVTAEDCLTAGVTFVGSTTSSGQEVDALYAAGYYNYKTLSDTSPYFKLPSFCDSSKAIHPKVKDAARRLMKIGFF
ncbi:uncharacterized protein [Antedon mediterranea]|uniref:uncharacterized protein n=1 Tax=Antedon mediterranea TaxID=105859 RepID=UPI003AF71ACF